MEVKKKLVELANKIYEDLIRGKNPYIDYRTRGLGNVRFDEEKRIIVLGEKVSKRFFFNIGHVRRFTQALLVASLSKRLLDADKHASQREVYYQLKHTVPGLKINTFEDEPETIAAIEDLERSFGGEIIREQMHITAKRKGYIHGDITLRWKEDEFNCSKLGLGGWGIPSTIEEIEIVDINADYVLVIETTALFERLIEDKFHERNNAILIATEGQASRGTRRLIHRLRYEHNLPVIVFTDGDPWGFYIYSVIKQGSINLAYLSKQLATPDAKFVGMTMDDIEEYGLQRVTEKLKDIDKKRLMQEMKYPWFKNKEWQEQLQKMLKKGVRIEQQALAHKKLEFVSETYLPEKISQQKFLP